MSSLLKLMVVIPALLCLMSQSADAQRVRLKAEMGANDAVQAQAKFEQRGARMKFNVEVEDGAPNQTYGVMIVRGGRVIDSGLMQSDVFGVAEIDIDNTEGDVVPRLRSGDVVQIWFNGRRILAGTLR